MKVTSFKQVVLLLGVLFFCSPSITNAQQKSDFTARLINLESATKDPFRYDLTLKNNSSETVVYSMNTKLPIGWNSSFKVSGSQVTALQMAPDESKTISFEVNAPSVAEVKTYQIPVSAISPHDTLHLELEAVVKGNYEVELTTPTGLLSTNVTEGSSKTIELIVKNTGSLPLEGLELTASSPSKWETNFDLSKIDNLKAGESKTINATVNVPNKTIAGDYMTSITVKNSLVNSKADFRVTVQTSILTGWIGIVIILLAIALIYFLIRKYGRR